MAAEKGRVTIPTDLDVIKETLDIMGEWAQMQSVTVMEPSFRRN